MIIIKIFMVFQFYIYFCILKKHQSLIQYLLGKISFKIFYKMALNISFLLILFTLIFLSLTNILELEAIFEKKNKLKNMMEIFYSYK